MTDLIQNTDSPVQPVPNVPEVPKVESKPDPIKDLKTKLIPVIMPIWQKIYANKLVFWLIIGVFGLLLLVIILGLLFGKRGVTTNLVSKATPTPQTQATTKPVVNDQFSPIEQNLNDLKNQINSLDVKQSQLQPPAVNFDVKF